MLRFFDITLSLIALLVLFPLLFVVVIILRLTGEGEIFYFQDRLGKYCKTFKLWKFATMLKNSPSMGTGDITIAGDPRILPFGRVMRKSKLNEIPQLVNVIKGDMSLIGPRPLTERNFDFYSREVKDNISSIRPGLSGVGSIIFRNEENMLLTSGSSVDFYRKVIAPYKGKVEKWYSENNSITNYFKLIAVTIHVVLFPKSKLIWSLLPDIPKPDEELNKYLLGSI